MKDKFSKFINLQGKYLTSLLILLALSIGQIWADDIYYVAMVQNVAEDGTLSGTSGTLKVVKYTASTETYGVTDAVSWSLSNPSVGCKGSSVSKCSDISDYTKWQQGSGSQKAKGPKFSGTTTLSLGSLTATKITFIGYRNSSSGGSLQIGSGDAKTTAKKPSSTFTSDCVVEYTGSYTGDVSVVASAEHCGVFVITASSTPSTSAPSITAPTADQSASYTIGQTITALSVTATGTPDPTFQWYSNSSASTEGASPISGATNASYTPLNTVASDLYYYCVATNSEGFANSPFFHVMVSAAPAGVCPSGLTISGTQAYTEGQTISLAAALSAGNGAIVYQWYKGSIASGNEVGTNSNELTISSCSTTDEGDYFCVASKDDCSDAESTAYAVTVDAMVACATLTPATSGSAIAIGDVIDLQTGSTGGTMTAIVKSGSTSSTLAYDANGLSFASSGNTSRVSVELNHLMQVGTVIQVTLMANGNGNDRGLDIYNASGTKKGLLGWTSAQSVTSGTVASFTYTVVAGDGLDGANTFMLYRNNSVYLQSLSVYNCGAELHALTSAIDPVHDPAYATVTLSKSLIAAGGTATATYSAIDAAYDFDEWQISGATIDDASANPVTITMGSTDAVITLKLKAASVKHTVTYYDGATELGTEQVEEGSNPTATGIVAPHKLGYTFDGWSTTNGGAAVALNTISVAVDMPLYAVYSEINCAALSGTIFSLAMDVAPAANCTIRSGSGFETEADLDQYAAISGGIAMAKNSSTSNHLIITTTPTVKLAGGNGKIHIQFDCALKEGDKIKTTISSQNIAYTTTDSRSTTNYFTKGTDQELTITSGHALENATEIYLWAASSNGGELVSLQVIRPVKYAVTFNMHDHGDAVDPQYIVEGGKVTEPATASITGWDFGGWYKESTFENAWDFATDVVGTSAVELHAKWTEHAVSSNADLSDLTVNGVTVEGFDAATTVYNIELPMGTTVVPTVAGVKADANAKSVVVSELLALPGAVTVTVTAENDATKTYTINFTVATSKDIELVWDKSVVRCDATTPSAVVKSDDASVSAYINKITATAGGEGSSLIDFLLKCD